MEKKSIYYLDTWTFPKFVSKYIKPIDCQDEWTNILVNLNTNQVRQLEIDTLFQRIVDLMESCGPESSNNFETMNNFRTRIVRLYTNMVDLEKIYHTNLQQLWRIYKNRNFKASEELDNNTASNPYDRLSDIFEKYKKKLFDKYYTSNPTMKDLLASLDVSNDSKSFSEPQFIVNAIQEYQKQNNQNTVGTNDITINDVLDYFKTKLNNDSKFIDPFCKTLADELTVFNQKMQLYSNEAGDLEKMCTTG